MLSEMRRTTYNVEGGYEISIAEIGAGPTIVFLHGSGPGASGASNFRLNIDTFVAAGYRVLLPDLIGYGASSKPSGIDYTLQLFTDTVYEALTAANVESAILVGNSLGGGVAMQMALDHPGFVTRLVMMAPGCVEELPVYFAMPGIAKMMGDFTSPDFTEADQRRLVSNLVYDPSVISDALVSERYAVARTQSKDVLARMKTPNLAPRLGELTMPILGFWGLQDDFCPVSGAQRFLDACPDARFMTFNKVGHWVQVERAAEFNRYAIAFLNG
ncbi:alpha/beta fold hydrolase [Sphingomonas paeninsulae]|uniref:Alpha/beta fold hydrolase n=1 Tax=Sphingomonas paeninsulae TaxID=2319844 RepID=A0A494TCW3_SPHPE|nr:alpha/beta fold hydrolase [Sphingomonas paeninsulae]AYJ87040.1 alpha/beta fold hydrolase [Sphingomonas paeninsulae]